MADALRERWELVKSYDPDLLTRPSAAPTETLKRYHDILAVKTERGDFGEWPATLHSRLLGSLIIRLGLEALERELADPERLALRLEVDNLLADEQADRDRDRDAAAAEAERAAQQAAERERVEREAAEAERQGQEAAKAAEAARKAAAAAEKERVEWEKRSAADRRRREARLAELRQTAGAPPSLAEQQAGFNRKRADELEVELARIIEIDAEDLADIDEQIAATTNANRLEALQKKRLERRDRNVGAIGLLRQQADGLKRRIRGALSVH
jgi:hypothetical protein